jgi:hypothetical protein
MQTAKNLQARVKSGCFLERLIFVASLPHCLNSRSGQLDLVTFDVSDANDAKGGGVNVTNVINVTRHAYPF